MLVSGLLDHEESESFSMDTLFTLAFMGYIWYMLRRSKGKSESAPPPTSPLGTNQNQATVQAKPVPTTVYTLSYHLKSNTANRIIQHKSPWTIVEQGKPVGFFRHTPIPAWIRTSDNRQADYAGIALNPPPEECVCLELPDQAELILPPGLIYAIRS